MINKLRVIRKKKKKNTPHPILNVYRRTLYLLTDECALLCIAAERSTILLLFHIYHLHICIYYSVYVYKMTHLPGVPRI